MYIVISRRQVYISSLLTNTHHPHITSDFPNLIPLRRLILVCFETGTCYWACSHVHRHTLFYRNGYYICLGICIWSYNTSKAFFLIFLSFFFSFLHFPFFPRLAEFPCLFSEIPHQCLIYISFVCFSFVLFVKGVFLLIGLYAGITGSRRIITYRTSFALFCCCWFGLPYYP